MSLPPDTRFLDSLILRSPQGTILTPICAKEVFVLRTIGIRWQQFVGVATQAQKELMAQPGGFGPADFRLYVTRKSIKEAVISTTGQVVELPQELFEWPLSK